MILTSYDTLSQCKHLLIFSFSFKSLLPSFWYGENFQLIFSIDILIDIFYIVCYKNAKLFKHYIIVGFFNVSVICLATLSCLTLCKAPVCGYSPGKNTGPGGGGGEQWGRGEGAGGARGGRVGRWFPGPSSGAFQPRDQTQSPALQILYHLSHQGVSLLVKGMPICNHLCETEV